MPVTGIDGRGGAVITGAAVLGVRGLICKQAIAMYLRTGGRMVMTRGATPKNLLAIASEFTGKPYKNSRKALEQAHADLEALLTTKSLDEVGETRQVNKLVGGVAADLAKDRTTDEGWEG